MKSFNYLPIGTICTLRGSNSQVMIVGYYSINYNGIIRIYDYNGIIYPEGTLLKNRNISFNHSDISNVEFLGYRNEKYELLNKKMLSNKERYSKDKKIEKNIVMNFEFDENGVVIYDPINNKRLKTEDENQVKEIKNNDYNNPFQEKYVESKENFLDKKKWTIFNK